MTTSWDTADTSCDVCEACGRGNGAPHTAECPIALEQDLEDGVMTKLRFRITVNEEKVYYSSAKTEEEAWAEYERGDLYLDHAEEWSHYVAAIDE